MSRTDLPTTPTIPQDVRKKLHRTAPRPRPRRRPLLPRWARQRPGRDTGPVATLTQENEALTEETDCYMPGSRRLGQGRWNRALTRP
jgi:hypothetical protein